MKKLDNIVKCLICAVAIYIGVAVSAYRFRNPELTETQLFQRTWDALLWR